jgi:acetyltransferase-like isoleucine patch superfamily enzyme
MTSLVNKLDARLLWGVRHLAYKVLAGRLEGTGYLGAPSFVKGFRKFHSKSGLGIFPGWRIEILDGKVQVGANVRIGNNFFLNCGSLVSIGDNVTLSSNVFIGTSDVVIDKNIELSFKDWPQHEQPIDIKSGCFIGYGAVILPGTKLGVGCVVGANSVVRGEFSAGSVIAGSPARLIRVR